MRIRTFAAAAAVSVAAALPLAGTALAADRDCADFASQADAQAAFDSRPGDPERLDADDDGVACETEDYGAAPAASTASPAAGTDEADDQVAAKPVGGVDAGGGPEPVAAGGLAVVLGATAAAGVGAVAVRRVARKAG